MPLKAWMLRFMPRRPPCDRSVEAGTVRYARARWNGAMLVLACDARRCGRLPDRPRAQTSPFTFLLKSDAFSSLLSAAVACSCTAVLILPSNGLGASSKERRMRLEVEWRAWPRRPSHPAPILRQSYLRPFPLPRKPFCLGLAWPVCLRVCLPVHLPVCLPPRGAPCSAAAAAAVPKAPERTRARRWSRLGWTVA